MPQPVGLKIKLDMKRDIVKSDIDLPLLNL